jgi:hypothetical protein
LGTGIVRPIVDAWAGKVGQHVGAAEGSRKPVGVKRTVPTGTKDKAHRPTGPDPLDGEGELELPLENAGVRKSEGVKVRDSSFFEDLGIVIRQAIKIGFFAVAADDDDAGLVKLVDEISIDNFAEVVNGLGRGKLDLLVQAALFGFKTSDFNGSCLLLFGEPIFFAERVLNAPGDLGQFPLGLLEGFGSCLLRR